MTIADVTLQLPQIPKDCYYEDYVAAILNAGGYYLDRSVHRTEDGLDLLELDVVATKFVSDHYENTIIEVKSGGWGIKDLFKINGWLNFLSHDKAAFIYQIAPVDKDEPTMQEVARKLKIDLLSNPLQADGKIDDTAILKSFGIDLTNVPKHAIGALRYAYDLERIMLDYIHVFSRDNGNYQMPGKVYQYFRKLIDESFFIKDPLNRLRFLTDLSIKHKNIACILEKELKGEGVLTAEQCILFDNLYEIENPTKMGCRPVDVALYVQLLNRLLTLKGVTEYILISKTQEISEFDEFVRKLNYDSQNSNIIWAIEVLSKRPYFYLYPYFFQIFFFVYGGFFMMARKNEEYKVLSDITGLPVDEIDSALSFWDILFPVSSSWMKTMNHRGLYYMQFVPAPLRGLGVNYRRHLYSPDDMEDSDELFNNLKSLVSVHCYNDMIHWNNAAYIMLKEDTVLHQKKIDSSSKMAKHISAAEEYIQRKTIYTEVKSLTDLAISVNCHNFNIQGFLCKITPESYDLFIIKPKNNLLSFPINQVIGELRLNQGQMRYCFVMGTDEGCKKTEDDTIWITGTVHNASLDRLDVVVEELDKLT